MVESSSGTKPGGMPLSTNMDRIGLSELSLAVSVEDQSPIQAPTKGPPMMEAPVLLICPMQILGLAIESLARILERERRRWGQ